MALQEHGHMVMFTLIPNRVVSRLVSGWAGSMAFYELAVFDPSDAVLNPMWRQGMFVLPFMTRMFQYTFVATTNSLSTLSWQTTVPFNTLHTSANTVLQLSESICWILFLQLFCDRCLSMWIW